MELETLVDRYGSTLLRAALAILGDPYEAEDAVQDAFLCWLEKRPVFRDEGHQRAWLLTVTANGCKSRLRARKRHPTQELLDVYPAPDGESREVSLLANGTGCKFSVHCADGEQAERLCSRLARFAILEGFDLSALDSAGAVSE